MDIISVIDKLRSQVGQARSQGKKIALVPTMGNLHRGHLSLVKKAKEVADFVIVSIFVNPLQFGPNEDFDSYPRTLDNDCRQLEALQTDVVFTPDAGLMYPEGKENHTSVRVDILDGMHCGSSRPGFFTGVATVVLKLLNMTTPDIAIFGEKDFQQLTVIRKMVRDLVLPVSILGVPTVREKSGLAMSSRNHYLSNAQKEKAAFLYGLLQDMARRIKKGERHYDTLSCEGIEAIKKQGCMPDYFNVVSTKTLKTPDKNDRKLVILAACNLDRTRLIDNIQVEIES